jgi:hypothetical protein
MKKIKEELMKERETIHEKCMGYGFGAEQSKLVKGQCTHIEDSPSFDTEGNSLPKFCDAYAFPTAWWDRKGRCPLATHYKPDDTPTEGKRKKRVGQQKQKKG